MDHRSPLSELLTRARRRCLAHLVLDQSALAATIGMAGVIVLLLAGTEILNWYWIVLLTVASLSIGVYRLRKTIPSGYKLAQRIDRRLNLADSLSTAIHFSGNRVFGNQAIRERQRQEADQLATTVDLRQGIPFARPRFVYGAACLTAAALGLFALRYAVIGSLSLQPSLARIAFDTFFPSRPELARATRRKLPDKRKGAEMDPNSARPQDDLAMDPELQPIPDYEKPQDIALGRETKDKAANPDADNNTQAPNGNDAKQDQGSQAEAPAGAPNEDGQNSKQESKEGAKQASKSGSGNDGSSLMDKLRDAVADMVNKVKSNQSTPDNQKGQKSQAGNKSNEKGAAAQKPEHGASSPGQSDQQDADAGDKQPSTDGGPAQGSDAKAAPDSKSGIGSADGDKTARDAEQLAAMGKLSEILGKRSANVTGEMIVELGSSKQQLKTPWAPTNAAHVQAGGEIHRDEVPLIYQQFVQQYFEEIRKMPDSSGAGKRSAGKNSVEAAPPVTSR